MLKTIIGPYTAADGFMAQRSFKHEWPQEISKVFHKFVDVMFYRY